MERFRPPADVFEEDWDNLIILDACRFDLIDNEDFRGGSVDWRWSGKSNSEEFLEHNVSGRILDDVVWVTANPWVSKFEQQIYVVEHLWRSHWDVSLKTVTPGDVRNAATDSIRRHPDKRLVVHFM